VFLHHVKKTPMRQKHWVMLRIISTAKLLPFRRTAWAKI